jgi:hypothetical protein
VGTYKWGDPEVTSGFNGPWSNPGVKTNDIPMPSFRLSRNGLRPFYMGGIRRGYASGPASISHGIFYAGVETAGNRKFNNSGGVMAFFIRGSSGTLYFGRDLGMGNTVISENSGFTWPGTLAGEFDFAEVPTAPTNAIALLGADKKTISFTITASINNGGSAISTYLRETSVNGGPYAGSTTAWHDTFVGIPGNSYRFRFWARNGVGDSQDAYTATVVVPKAGGRRMTGPSSSTPITIAKRFNGSSWVDLSTRKIYKGSAFTDLTN